jgi:hypothetical protein
MEVSHIVDIWLLFKDQIDKKVISITAEQYVDQLADFGVTDQTLKMSIGNCDILDAAIAYYLDIDDDTDYDE